MTFSPYTPAELANWASKQELFKRLKQLRLRESNWILVMPRLPELPLEIRQEYEREKRRHAR